MLDGNAWVDFGDPGSAFDIVPGGRRTFALWLRYTRPAYHAKILDKMGADEGPGFAIFVEPYSTSFGFWYKSGVPIDATGYTKAGVAGTHRIGDGAWHFVAVVQRDTLAEGYVDGKLDWQADISKTLPGMANDQPLMLGWNGSDVVRFAGEMDELSIWSRALSARQVRHLMYHRPDADASGLEGYWPMDSGDGQVVVDRSPHGRNGIGTGITRAPATRPLAPPLRERPAFRVLVGALLLLALYGLMRMYAWRLQRQKRRLERQVSERVADLARTIEEKDRALDTVAAQARRLEDLDLAKRRFFTNISHEFRTPLSLIIGPLSDLAKTRADTWDDELRRTVTVALRNGRRLGHLTEQILDLARLESGVLRIEAAPLNLTVLLGELAEAFRLGAERRGVRFEEALPGCPVAVFGDSERLETIFANLLSNAIRFTPEGGTVRLRMTASETSVQVEVSDEGPGIPADQAERIFDRFYQTSLGAEGRGSGIGLALVRELVQLHGGDVALVPGQPGEGALFRVRLPVHSGALDVVRQRSSSTWGAVAPGEDLTEVWRIEAVPQEFDRALPPVVLLAEDDEDLRAYVASHLSRSYRVLEVADGRSALALARKHVPDLVVSDVMMPAVDGMSLLRQLRDDPDLDTVPVVLLTARAEVEDRLEGLDLGADAYLVKPFELAELSARVKNLLEQRKRLRQRVLEEAARAADETAPVGVGEPPAAALEAHLRHAVEAHLGDSGFGVSELAACVAMERTGLYRRMMEELEISPSDYMRDIRLQKASTLLKEGNTVAEVAYAVGYESFSSFSRAFKERFGETPGRYARSERGMDVA